MIKKNLSYHVQFLQKIVDNGGQMTIRKRLVEEESEAGQELAEAGLVISDGVAIKELCMGWRFPEVGKPEEPYPTISITVEGREKLCQWLEKLGQK